MKKKYVTPFIEKITYDYKIQTSSTAECFESVINVRVGGTYDGSPVPKGVCVEGIIVYIGWTKPQTGV